MKKTMKRGKLILLKALLYAGAAYFLIAAVAHFFGLTIFPFYDGALYQPYHDMLIGFCALAICGVLIVSADNPLKNIDIFNLILAGMALAVVFNIFVLLKIDFISLGSTLKHFQTLVEMILAGAYFAALYALRPKK